MAVAVALASATFVGATGGAGVSSALARSSVVVAWLAAIKP